MAIYHLHVKVIGRKSGSSAVASAAYRSGSWQLAWIVYDGLVAYRRTGGPSGNTVVPDLATALPVIQDGGRTYVFKLRNGSPVQVNNTVVPASSSTPKPANT